MKREETGNLSRDELFEKIKRKCVSRSRIDFYGGLAILIIMIVSFISHGTATFDGTSILGLIFAIALACMAGGLVLYSYWYQKKIEKTDNPSQLLHFYEKRSQRLIIFCLFGWLVWLGVKFVDFYRTARFDFEDVLLAIVFVASVFLIFEFFKPGTVNFRDMEIIEQLQDLIDKE